MLRQPHTKNVDYNAHTQQPTMFTLQQQSSHNFRNQQYKTYPGTTGYRVQRERDMVLVPGTGYSYLPVLQMIIGNAW